MSIVLHENTPDDCLRERLVAAGVTVLDETQAERQDIRAARIGIMNNMPANSAEVTEIQLLRWIGSQTLQIEPVLMKLDNDPRERPGASRRKIFERYTPFSQVAEQGLDGLIVTGDNLEIYAHARQGLRTGFSGTSNLDITALPAEKVDYYRQLQEVMDWADQNVYSTMFSCLGAHFALRHKFGIVKQVNERRGKIFGVYDHEIIDPGSALVPGMNDTVRAPHSRWGDVPLAAVLGEKALNIVAANQEVGWLFLESKNQAGGTDVYVQAHPEYDRLDLHREYERDKSKGLALPTSYYRDDVPAAANARLTWASDGRVFHDNWIGRLVYPGFSQIN